MPFTEHNCCYPCCVFDAAFKSKFERKVLSMEEKVYKTMNGAGALNIVLGVIAVVVGVTSGILLIISGSKLISRKSNILF